VVSREKHRTKIGEDNMGNKKTYVDTWLKRETEHKRNVLETASRHFDKSDTFSVHTLEAIYGQESSFGADGLGKRNSDGPAGHFQMKKATAQRVGLIISRNNDERFDIDQASSGSGKYLKILDN